MHVFSVNDELRIEELFNNIIALQSDTGTKMENKLSGYLHHCLAELSYFKKNSDHFGIEEIPDDPFARSIVWGLVKGTGKKTIVMMNHHDAIDLSPYGELKNIALEPTLLRHKLKSIVHDADVLEDLGNSEWIFGRGTADMKSGVAMQLWALEKFSEYGNFDGNILFLSVGDEENLSAGMRYAVSRLNEIAEGYDLNLEIAINSEPYDINDDEAPIIYQGSVGKVMPVVFARGKTSHIGQVYSGLNPTFLLSKLHAAIEVNPQFSDLVEGEVSAPPTWVYLRDGKKMYDASLPETAVAYFSVLTMTSTPTDIFNQVMSLSKAAFETCIEEVNNSYKHAVQNSRYHIDAPSLKSRVWSYEDLQLHLLEKVGVAYNKVIKETTELVKKRILSGEINLQEATILLIEKLVSLLPDNDPIMVVAYSGPFYPHVCNLDLPFDNLLDFQKIISDFSESKWGVSYEKRNYFLGISDFSYMSFMMGQEEIDLIESNMPGWEDLYYVPLDEMKKFKMQLVNIGPRGKDIHKMTERVSRSDAFYRTPQILLHLLHHQLF